MFPERPRRHARPMRPMSPRPERDPFLIGRTPRQMEEKPSNIQALMRMFQTPDGNMDIDKIMNTAQQFNGMYKQVSPMLSKLIKR